MVEERVETPKILDGEEYQVKLATVTREMMAARPDQVGEVEDSLGRLWGQYHRFGGESSDPSWTGPKVDPSTIERPPILVHPGAEMILDKGRRQHLIFLTDGLVISRTREAAGTGPTRQQTSQLAGFKFKGDGVVLTRMTGTVMAGRYAAPGDTDEGEFEGIGTFKPLARGIMGMRTGLLLTLRIEKEAGEITVTRIK